MQGDITIFVVNERWHYCLFCKRRITNIFCSRCTGKISSHVCFVTLEKKVWFKMELTRTQFSVKGKECTWARPQFFNGASLYHSSFVYVNQNSLPISEKSHPCAIEQSSLRCISFAVFVAAIQQLRLLKHAGRRRSNMGGKVQRCRQSLLTFDEFDQSSLFYEWKQVRLNPGRKILHTLMRISLSACKITLVHWRKRVYGAKGAGYQGIHPFQSIDGG